MYKCTVTRQLYCVSFSAKVVLSRLCFLYVVSANFESSLLINNELRHTRTTGNGIINMRLN